MPLLALSKDVFTGPAVFERLSHFVDVGIPATVEDPLNQRMIVDGTCRLVGVQNDGFYFYRNYSHVVEVILAMRQLPSTDGSSHFTLTALEYLKGPCEPIHTHEPEDSAQCDQLDFSSLVGSMDAWHRALCADKNDPSWKGVFDPAYQPQQIALTTGFMCIVTCDCARSFLSGDILAKFASSIEVAERAKSDLCSLLPFKSVNFTAQASNTEQLTKLSSPLRQLCNCL